MSGLASTSTRYSALSKANRIEASLESEAKDFSINSLPLGLQFVQRYSSERLSYNFHKYWALVLTFFIYVCYHASRRPLNVVKPILSPYNEVKASVQQCSADEDMDESDDLLEEGWSPFIGAKGNELLVGLDLTFLLSYAVGVVVAGRIADRSNLRHYLFWGMFLSGVAVFLFGMGHYWGIHNYAFYWILQFLTGLLQASGWPAVVAIVAQWFGKENRGLIMGIWTSHASVGNSIGSALSASVVHYGWGAAFLLLGSFMTGCGILFWFFLVPQPSDAGFAEQSTTKHSVIADDVKLETTEVGSKPEKQSISWFAALSIPGVIPFSIALFFSKFVAYTFLFWLPYYIASICINKRQLSAEEAGDFSILFDVGGIVGGAFAGVFYDMSGSGAAVSIGYSLGSIPLLLVYNHLGRWSVPVNMSLLFLCGFFVNGPFALITTAVSASLGTHESVAGNERALSTVAAIIDGMGSFGAALGPTLTGKILESKIKGGDAFNLVFLMLSLASAFCVVTLARTAWIEIKGDNNKKTHHSETTIELEHLVRKPVNNPV